MLLKKTWKYSKNAPYFYEYEKFQRKKKMGKILQKK